MSDEAEIVVGSRTDRGHGYVTRIEAGTWLLIAGGHDERIVATAERRVVCVTCGQSPESAAPCARPEIDDVGRRELVEKAKRRLIVNPVLVLVAEVEKLPGWGPTA